MRVQIGKEKQEELKSLQNRIRELEKGKYTDIIKYNKENAWLARIEQLLNNTGKSFGEVWQLIVEDRPHKAYDH